MSTTTSPRTSLAKLVLYPKGKPFKVMVLGQAGVGKSALVVRFITRRFIGEYDPNLEKVYACQTVIDNEMIYFEILDSAGDPRESEYANLESNIRWAEAFILMYSVTDKCSFDECHRLKFLINYNKRRRRLASSSKDNVLETPVVLVGNKIDQAGDRMVSTEEGQRRSKEIGCVCFHEISVRESIEQVWSVFHDVRRFWRVSSKWTKGKRTDPDIHPAALGRSLARAASDSAPEPEMEFTAAFSRRWTEVELDEEGEVLGVVRSDSTSSSGKSECAEEFRARASTDSRLPPRPARPRHPLPTRPLPPPVRRMSVAMKGNNASTY
ncbi:ras-related and estrogen-regulated growth inhibitor [Hyposmocoma kahamanoa]|uniref:ras-related and estrogen-regulated growth inhibitor n=1 Tax=Hyposmocoma kahamanoa TaxID=1477025 RepID=UPI000E6DA142|nr:ras-related and estrogen-regulated growth inhibitor [Hyposmocoma kahamanoa]